MIEALSSWLVVLDGSGSSLDNSTNSARSFSRLILAASLHFSFIFLTTIFRIRLLILLIRFVCWALNLSIDFQMFDCSYLMYLHSIRFCNYTYANISWQSPINIHSHSIWSATFVLASSIWILIWDWLRAEYPRCLGGRNAVAKTDVNCCDEKVWLELDHSPLEGRNYLTFKRTWELSPRSNKLFVAQLSLCLWISSGTNLIRALVGACVLPLRITRASLRRRTRQMTAPIDDQSYLVTHTALIKVRFVESRFSGIDCYVCLSPQ